MKLFWCSLSLIWRCCRLQTHGAVDPLGVVGDDGVNSRFFDLATLLPSIGSDSHCNAVEEQRTSRVTLRDEETQTKGYRRAQTSAQDRTMNFSIATL